ncbi:SGNH/GDSL hydrolase family protein [Acidobacteriota bacterium]
MKYLIPFFSAVLFLLPTPEVRAQTVKIMPLGDSITQANTDYDSFRRRLWRLLEDEGYDVDFVGSQDFNWGGPPPHSDFDRDHEGHAGWRADEVLIDLPGWADTYRPHIVLLHLGTNDIMQSQGVGSTIDELGWLIDELRAANPRVIVLLAKLIPHNWASPGVEPLNSQIPALAVSKYTSESPVIVVDQYKGFDATLDTYDGIHPDVGGESRMANKWFAALQPLLTPHLYRGVVETVSPGWRFSAFPLTASTDDETSPFPAETTIPGSLVDNPSEDKDLVFYRLLVARTLYTGNRLMLQKVPSGIELVY